MWRFYFWGVFIFYALGFISLIDSRWEAGIHEQGLILTLPAILGLYSFVYKKKVLSRIYWRYIGWLFFAVYAFYLIYIFFPVTRGFLTPWFIGPRGFYEAQTIMVLLLGVPIFYALDKLGNK